MVLLRISYSRSIWPSFIAVRPCGPYSRQGASGSRRASQIEGLDLDDEHLTTYADQISTGGGFDIDVHHLR
jgi:hypothetical protein